MLLRPADGLAADFDAFGVAPRAVDGVPAFPPAGVLLCDAAFDAAGVLLCDGVPAFPPAGVLLCDAAAFPPAGVLLCDGVPDFDPPAALLCAAGLNAPACPAFADGPCFAATPAPWKLPLRAPGSCLVTAARPIAL